MSGGGTLASFCVSHARHLIYSLRCAAVQRTNPTMATEARSSRGIASTRGCLGSIASRICGAECYPSSRENTQLIYVLASHELDNCLFMRLPALTHLRRTMQSLSFLGNSRDRKSMSLQRRFVRTGFFRSDFDFTDPDKVLVRQYC